MTRGSWMRMVSVTVLGVVAGSEWYRVFGWSVVGGYLVAASLVPALLACVVWRGHRPQVGTSVGISLVAMVWFVGVAVLRDSFVGFLPDPQAVDGFYHGLINGWSEILSNPLPVTGSRQILVFPAVLVWLSVTVGIELTLRTTRPLTGAIPPLVAFVTALLFGIGGPGSRLIPVLAFLAGGAVLAFGLAPSEQAGSRSETPQRARRLEVGAATSAVMLATGFLGPMLPFVDSGHPYDPRATWIEPSRSVQVVSPLVEISEWAHDSSHQLFTVTSNQPVTTQLAVLGSYSPIDGWTDNSRFTRAGVNVSNESPGFVGFVDGDGAVTSVRPAPKVVQQHIVVGSLPGPWLPAAMQPLSISGVRAFADRATGVMVASTDRAAGLSYTVTSRTSTSSADCVGHDAVPSDALVPSSGIAIEARNLAGGDAPPCAEAESLLIALSNGSYKVDANAPSGSNIQILQNFLYGANADSERGTSEQFASAFSLMAMSLGMRARVVVGFHPGTKIGSDTWQVTTKDAFAWAEIDFEGLGWVGFDPTPHAGQAVTAPEPEKGQASASPAPVPGGSQQQRFGPHRGVNQGSTSSSKSLAEILSLALGALALALALASGAVAVARRARRSRRRRAAGSRERILGAWEESLDLLKDIGVPASAWHTADEVTLAAVPRLKSADAEGLQRFTFIVNQALFAASRPGDVDAKEAWEYSEVISAAAREKLDFPTKCRRAFDVRVLVK